MKIHKAVKLYLLAIEMLPLVDELNCSNSLKKAVRTIESFAGDSCNKIEESDMSSELNEAVAIGFSRLMNGLEYEHFVEIKEE